MLTKLTIGGSGVALVEAIHHVPPVNPTIEVAKLVIQAIVGIATIIGLLKKPKPPIPPTQIPPVENQPQSSQLSKT